MLNWRGDNGDSFMLTVSGYEFPAELDGYDANWLTLFMSATNRSGNWTAQAACVLTWDLLSLSFWLTDIDDDEADSWCGLEIDLILTSLGWSRGRAVIAIHLSRGFRNVGIDSDGRGDRDLLIVELTPEELAVCSASVLATAAKFPARGKQGEKGSAAMRAIREKRLRLRDE
jgi:hypothetical protein